MTNIPTAKAYIAAMNSKPHMWLFCKENTPENRKIIKDLQAQLPEGWRLRLYGRGPMKQRPTVKIWRNGVAMDYYWPGASEPRRDSGDIPLKTAPYFVCYLVKRSVFEGKVYWNTSCGDMLSYSYGPDGAQVWSSRHGKWKQLPSIVAEMLTDYRPVARPPVVQLLKLLGRTSKNV